MKISRWILLVCAQVGLVAAASEVATESPLIARVLIAAAPAAGSSTFVNNLQTRRIVKFAPGQNEQPLRCDVELKSAALPPDSVIVFDYRLPDSTDSHTVRVSAGDVDAASHMATFYIPVPAGVDGSAIAWRARVVRDDQVIAERKSTLWR